MPPLDPERQEHDEPAESGTRSRVVIPVACAEAAVEIMAANASDEYVARMLTGELDTRAAAFLRLAFRFARLAEGRPEVTIAAFWCATYQEARRRVVAASLTTVEGAILLCWDLTDGCRRH